MLLFIVVFLISECLICLILFQHNSATCATTTFPAIHLAAWKILFVLQKVGHVQYYTRGLVLALLKESIYQMVETQHVGATFKAPSHGLKTYFEQMPRHLAFAINYHWGVRLFSGRALMVLAVAAESS